MKTVRIDDINYEICWFDGDIWLEPQVEVPDWILLWTGGDALLYNQYINTMDPEYDDYGINEYRADTIESFVSENKDQFIKIQQS